MLYAHSADGEKHIPGQAYTDHVNNVITLAGKAADEAARFSAFNGEMLKKIVRIAAEYHDLGKLDNANQEVLAGIKKAKNLPIQHTDAGTAYLLEDGDTVPAAALVRSHHIGLPDFIDESNKPEELLFRDMDENIRETVNYTLKNLVKMHNSEIAGEGFYDLKGLSIQGDTSVFFRIALSCLADGDHTDTGINYGEYPKEDKIIELKPLDRLNALDRYVSGIGNEKDERSELRSRLYHLCRNSMIDSGIASCDSPVGTGKTTAVMANLLSQAGKRKLRRIIVVLPFTNIITQSVEVYRKSLILPGENAEAIVAELHHRADFQDAKSRHLTALWRAPIIVTTAVAFFETLASNTPSTLRRLHNLPGSAVFIDESHAALPAKLLKLAWNWIKVFAGEWNCFWILASGSLNRFWQIPEFDKNPPAIPEIVPQEFRSKLSVYETNRVIYKYKNESLGTEQLVKWAATLPGPRLIILNTVQSAAAVAEIYKKFYGRAKIEHLSTALTPLDRDKTLAKIKQRLKNKIDDDWSLIATSCVEAGVDLSFRTGIRELCSLVSLLQTSGRVNRQGSITDSEVWTIRLQEEGLLKKNPGIKESAEVLLGFLESQSNIDPELCTEALKREIRIIGTDLEKLNKSEKEMRFPQVEVMFNVISNDTRVVIIDKQLIRRIENYEHIDWQEIQRNSVNIWGFKLDSLGIEEIHSRPGLYKWNLEYNDFIGYMAGALFVEDIKRGSGGALII